MDSAAVAKRGPIIQGIGVCRATHAKAAKYPTNKVQDIRRIENTSGCETLLEDGLLVHTRLIFTLSLYFLNSLIPTFCFSMNVVCGLFYIATKR